MIPTDLIHRLARLAGIALVAATIGTLGVSVQELSARGSGCVDYRCENDSECEKVECDLCHTDSRCALKPY